MVRNVVLLWLVATGVAFAGIPTNGLNLSDKKSHAVSLAELVGKIKIATTTTAVEVYLRSAPLENREKKPCLLAVAADGTIDLGRLPADCPDLAAAAFAGDTVTLTLARPKQGSFTVLIFEARPLQSAAASVKVGGNKDGTFAGAEIEEHVHFADPTCYVRLPRQWVKATCSAKKLDGVDAAGQHAITSALARGDKLQLYAVVIDADAPGADGAVRRIPVTTKEKAAPLGRFDIDVLCKEAISKADVDGAYHVCVDLRNKQQAFIAQDCKTKASCKGVGEVLRVNRQIVVHVWTDGEKPKIALGGTAGMTPEVLTASAGAGAPVIPKPTVSKLFDGRKPGSAPLTITMPKETTAAFEHTFQIETQYRLAIRLGFGVSYLPWGQTFGVVTTLDNQKVSGVIQDELVRTEVLAGVSWLFEPIRKDSLDRSFGVGFRLGVLSLSDAKAISSLMGGFEYSIGSEVSFGLYIGAGRIDVPDEGYEPGRLVSGTTLPTHWELTPQVALVIDLAGGVFKNVGLVK